ncbi:MAG: major facilitator transporter [Anaerolineaceae bacterium]|nr:MAG: major facilitator transporter [Anaerolineaceae bacterium]
MKNFVASTLNQFRLLNRPARLFLLAIFLDGLLFSGFILFLNLYILDAGYSRDFLGMLNAAPSISALLLGVPMGLLSDRMGRKRAMMLGFTLANFAIIGMLLSHTEILIIALALVWGAAGQLYFLSHAPFMMKVSDDKSRDILFSFSFAMFPLAGTLGSFLAGYLPGVFRDTFGIATSAAAYQAVLLFSVTASFLVLLPIALIREPKSAPAEKKDGITAGRPSVWKVLFRPLTLKLAIPNLVIGFGAATLVPYFNVFFAEQHRMSDASLGLLFSGGSLITGVACITGPRLVGNLGGKIRTIVIAQAASLGFLLLVGFSPWAWLAVIGFLARGALMNMTAPLFDAFSLELTHETEHGAVNSIRNLAWNVGWAVGPYISGLVQQRYGFSPLFISTAILYGIAIGLTWIFFRPKARRDLEPVTV